MGKYLARIITLGLLLASPMLLAAIPAEKLAADQGWASASDTLAEVDESLSQLNQALNQLLATPTTEHLQAARTAWHQSHNRWLQLSPLLQLAKVDGERFRELGRWVYLVDAAELQPGYLDALPDYPYSGLVNDLAIRLTAASVREQHGLTDDSEVAQGFHALELLLWGAEGQRPATDFVESTTLNPAQRQAGYALAEVPNNRRRVLLRLLGQILQEDTRQLRNLWGERDTVLGRSYWRLKSERRLPLMRRAAQFSLTENNAHTETNFSEKDARPLILQALHTWMTRGEPSLISVMLPPADARTWLAQLQAEIEILKSSTTSIDEGRAERWQKLAQKLEPKN